MGFRLPMDIYGPHDPNFVVPVFSNFASLWELFTINLLHFPPLTDLIFFLLFFVSFIGWQRLQPQQKQSTYSLFLAYFDLVALSLIAKKWTSENRLERFHKIMVAPLVIGAILWFLIWMMRRSVSGWRILHVLLVGIKVASYEMVVVMRRLWSSLRGERELRQSLSRTSFRSSGLEQTMLTLKLKSFVTWGWQVGVGALQVEVVVPSFKL